MTRIYSFAMVVIALLSTCPQQTPSKSASGNIIVSMPHRGDVIGSPVKVVGKARVFEAALTIRVLTSGGKQLARADIMASQGAPEFGDFSVQVRFKKPAGVSRGFVEALSYSAKDGSPINVVKVPVRFK